MLQQTRNPRRALSGRLNDPRASEITSAGMRVLWILSTLSEQSPRRGFSSRRRGDEVETAIVAAEAHVSVALVRGMASLN